MGHIFSIVDRMAEDVKCDDDKIALYLFRCYALAGGKLREAKKIADRMEEPLTKKELDTIYGALNLTLMVSDDVQLLAELMDNAK